MWIDFIDFLEGLRKPFLTVLFNFITLLGDEIFYILAISTLYWIWDKDRAYRLLHYILVSQIINSALKVLIRSPRPHIEDPEAHWAVSKGTIDELKNSSGMPSGHAQTSTVFWGFFYLREQITWKKIVFIIIVGLIGFSRLYLGVHFLEDVIVGYLVGILTLLGLERVYDSVQKYIEPLSFQSKLSLSLVIPPVVGSIAVLSLGLNPATETLGTVVGVYMGGIAGYLIENKWVMFTSKASNWLEGGIRIFIGVLVTATVYIVLKLIGYGIFGDSITWVSFYYRVLRYFLLALTITVLLPYLFTKIEIE